MSERKAVSEVQGHSAKPPESAGSPNLESPGAPIIAPGSLRRRPELSSPSADEANVVS